MAFRFTVVTTGSNETFTLPLVVTGTYNFVVDWGDTNNDTITAWDDAAKTHTYASADTYEISITGTLKGFSFNNEGDIAKVYDLKEFGILDLGDEGGCFHGCSNLTVSAVDNLVLSSGASLENLFAGCSSLTTISSINSWDVSGINNMEGTFWGSAFNQDISGWDVSNVTSMLAMFSSNTYFNQDISGWNVSNVTNMTNMFLSGVFNQDISGWDVSNVTNMTGMFLLNLSFNQDISGWDVSSVTTMNFMFAWGSTFDQNIGPWNITSMVSMANMFASHTLSTSNYNAILIGWEAQAVLNNVTFDGGNSEYDEGPASVARQALIDDHNWTITDGGEIPSPPEEFSSKYDIGSSRNSQWIEKSAKRD